MANNGEISINILQDTQDNFGVFHIEQDQLDIDIQQESTITDLDIDIIDGTSGITQINHTEDLVGDGTRFSPLGLSDDFKHKVDGKQDQLTPGPGISIDEDNVISVTNSFIYEQGVASTTWEITHNLGRNPTVVVIDTSGNVVYPSVHYNNLNTCTITMNYAFKGTAYLN